MKSISTRWFLNDFIPMATREELRDQREEIDSCNLEQKHFCKIILFVFELLVPLLRQILSTKVKYYELRTSCSMLSDKDQKNIQKHVIDFFRILRTRKFPQYDFSFLYSVFRYVPSLHIDSPTKKWGEKPANEDRTFSDDLERLRFIKNDLSHPVSASLDTKTYQIKWDDLFSITIRWEALLKSYGKKTNFEEEAHRLSSKSIDSDTYRSLIQQYKEALETEACIKEWIKDHCTLPAYMSTTDTLIMKFQNENNRFYKTSAAVRALKLLGESMFIILVGCEGDGKTSVGKFLLSSVSSRIVFIMSLEEFKNLSIQPTKRYAIFIDDCFDELQTIEKDSKVLKTKYPHIQDGTVQLIIACKPSSFQVFSHTRMFCETQMDSKHDNVVCISNGEHELPPDDKTGIVRALLNLNQLSDDIVKELVSSDLPFGFPKCLSRMSQNIDGGHCLYSFLHITRSFYVNVLSRKRQFDSSTFAILMQMFQSAAITTETEAPCTSHKADALNCRKVMENLTADRISKGNILSKTVEEAMAIDCSKEEPGALIRNGPLRFFPRIRISQLSYLDADVRVADNEELHISRDHADAIHQRVNKELETKDPMKFEIIAGMVCFGVFSIEQMTSIFDLKDRENNTLQIHAVRRDNYSIVRCVIKTLTNVKTSCSIKAMLIEACMRGNERMTKFLLEEYEKQSPTSDFVVIDAISAELKQTKTGIADILQLIRDKDGNNLLMITAKSRNIDLLKYLLSQTGDEPLRDTNNGGETILHAAVMSHDSSVTDFVLSRLSDEDLTAQDAKGNTAFHLACALKDTGVLYSLGSRNTDAFTQDYNSQGMLPLHRGISGACRDAVCVLKDLKVDFRLLTKAGETVLHLAAKRCRGDDLKYIITCIQDLDIIHKTDTAGKTALHAASEFSTSSVLLRMKDLGLKMDATTNCGDTVWHLASSAENMELLSDLLQKYPKQSSIQLRNDKGLTPIHSCAVTNNTSVLQLLLENTGLSLKDTTNNGCTALHLAANKGCKYVFDYIIQRHPRLLNFPDHKRALPFHYAASGGHIDIFKKCLMASSSNTVVKTVTSQNETIFHLAVVKNQEAFVEFILFESSLREDHEFLVAANESGYTALHIAISCGYTKLTETLVREVFTFEKYPLKALTLNGSTVLHLAVQSNNPDMVRYILERKDISDILHITDKRKMNALHIAVLVGSSEIFNMLADRFKLTAVTGKKETILHIVATNGNDELLHLIMKRKNACELLNKRNRDYLSPFLLALKNGQLQRGVELHRQYPSSASDRNGTSHSCLHFAAESGKIGLVRWVLDTFENAMERKTTTGESARFSAITGGNIKIFDILKSATIVAHNEYTILHHASKLGKLDFVKHILMNFWDLRYRRDCRGYSCLHFAAEAGRLEVVKYLYEKGYKLEHDTDKGKTILHLAIYHVEMVNWIFKNAPLLAERVDIHGNTPLHLAIKAASKAKSEEDKTVLSETRHILKRRNVKVLTMKNKKGQTPEILWKSTSKLWSNF